MYYHIYLSTFVPVAYLLRILCKHMPLHRGMYETITLFQDYDLEDHEPTVRGQRQVSRVIIYFNRRLQSNVECIHYRYEFPYKLTKTVNDIYGSLIAKIVFLEYNTTSRLGFDKFRAIFYSNSIINFFFYGSSELNSSFGFALFVILRFFFFLVFFSFFSSFVCFFF